MQTLQVWWEDQRSELGKVLSTAVTELSQIVD